MWGAYFCMDAYKRDVLVVIKMVLIFMGCLFFEGALLSGFYDIHLASSYLCAHLYFSHATNFISTKRNKIIVKPEN